MVSPPCSIFPPSTHTIKSPIHDHQHKSTFHVGHISTILPPQKILSTPKIALTQPKSDQQLKHTILGFPPQKPRLLLLNSPPSNISSSTSSSSASSSSTSPPSTYHNPHHHRLTSIDSDFIQHVRNRQHRHRPLALHRRPSRRRGASISASQRQAIP